MPPDNVTIRQLLSREDECFYPAVDVIVAALTAHDPYGPTAICGGDPSLFTLLTISLMASCIKCGTVWILLDNEKEVLGVAGLLGPGQTRKNHEPEFSVFLEKLSPEGKKFHDEVLGPFQRNMKKRGLPFDHEDTDRYTVEFLGIHPAYERKGLGKLLMKRCLGEVEEEQDPVRGAARFWLVSSPIAVPFYRACGLKETYSEAVTSAWGSWTETVFLWERTDSGKRDKDVV
ncbi:hypothetical protein M422DRAFT_26614 [Sphaerobolus stellatus SS14]|nr:hypothetical protein M422DRAFT_26614 [Sphaerobolus stellatus SS14]